MAWDGEKVEDGGRPDRGGREREEIERGLPILGRWRSVLPGKPGGGHFERVSTTKNFYPIDSRLWIENRISLC